MEKVTVRIEDNSIISSDYLDSVSNVVQSISNKSVKKLNEEGLFVFPSKVRQMEDVESNDFIIQEVDGSFQTSNLIGFFQFGNEELIIQSRFSDENNFFISYLLERVLGMPNVISTSTSFDNKDNIISILMFIFPHYLKNAVKKGLYKTYVRKDYNDANLKGPINISKHIKLNTPFKGSINYSQRELTSNNYLLQLIRHVIEFIRQKPNTSNILYLVKDEVKDIVAATPNYEFHDRQRLIKENKKKPIRHAYYSEYRILQELCILILSSSNHNIGTGTSKVNGILFDVAWLWEEYVNLIIKDDFHHPKNKSNSSKSGAQWLFTRVQSSNKNQKIGKIYPDFISKDIENRIIIDAKYKPYENIGNRDYLQLLAYMYRFEARVGYYIYPEVNIKDNFKYHINQYSSYDQKNKFKDDSFVKKIGFNIPAEVNEYIAFKEIMRQEESKVNYILDCKPALE